jgi:hypothetical protein
MGDRGRTVVITANGKKITVGPDGDVVTESAPAQPALAGMPSMSAHSKPGGMG